MVLLEFSMSPMDKGESVSAQVSRSLKIIDDSGVPYRLNPMGTVLEGEFDEVIGVVKQCYEVMNADCQRITCGIKIPKGQKAKQVVLQYLLDNEPQFEVEYTSSGNPKPKYYDIADSIVIARAGQKLVSE